MNVLRTLRGRLVLVLVGASLVGLALMGSASIGLLNRSLMGKVDQRLAEMSRPWAEGWQLPPTPPGDIGQNVGLPTDFRVLFFDSSGRQTGILGQTDQEVGGPLLENPPHKASLATVPDRAGGTAWRVRTVVLPNGDVIALSLSLDSVYSTLNRLVAIELGAGALVLAVLAVVATATVRLSMRPLTRIEETADAIAAGQLERRVPEQDPCTETGRLGTALNTMLTRLVDALQQREQSEQRLRRFVADASHELRTPLTSIRGFAELYRRSDNPRTEDVRMMMGRIESEAVRMGGLVEDLLLLAQLDRERTVDLTDVDLVKLAQDVVHDAGARDPGREIVLRGTDHPLRVVGDSHRLRQVLTNLVNNALVHSLPDHPIIVEVSHGVADGPALAAVGAELPTGSPTAVLSVSDDGPGIPREHAARIFDRFYRVDDARSRGGTGLGLAITAAIAEAHNGRLELHRNNRGGSTFKFLLPLS
ncbi:sensor histidine kinase [Kribbella sindirgiensis]|uniref:histidine kinase n=1 Tax=Kribbella sindirgiensis TaxID=1124744 RepID=A0A4R0IFX8_9ACTN|nr:HAMP domain-containing sensor histidine kinase [Kribbella sindirgiensis]TCC32191.1 HAMP domain-containing histidine kinase [Kribbella sindirgiensis]